MSASRCRRVASDVAVFDVAVFSSGAIVSPVADISTAVVIPFPSGLSEGIGIDCTGSRSAPKRR